MRSRVLALILCSSLMLSNCIPVLAKNYSEATDKYSTTNATKESRTTNQASSDVAAEYRTADYLQTSVSPGDIQFDSQVPEGFKKTYTRKGGGGKPVYVTNDVGVDIVNDAPSRPIKGTVLRSINNKASEDLYTPPIDDLPWLKTKIIKDMGFGALYEGEWNYDTTQGGIGSHDPNRTTDGKETVSTRANKVLGADALVVDESYNDGSGYKCSALKSTNIVKLRDAITIAYKALSQNYYWIQAYPREVGKAVIPVGNTPFVESVGAENAVIDNTRYYTDVWVSRTMPKTYYNQALRDGITAYTYNDEESGKNISIADFCVIVSKLLDLNGEDVIIDQEAQQLLSVYQRNIPAYLTSTQQDAIKYLMVRGILDGKEKFKDDITADFALTILMRAKDKSSRLTFKQIEIPYDKSLLNQGFTGVDLSVSSPAKEIKVVNNTASSQYYDYFIKISNSTTFKDINGKTVTAMYVSNQIGTSGSDGATRVEGSDYIGEVDGYYHFKIPVNASNTFVSSGLPANVGKVFTITTRNADNKPTMYFVEEGGGVYDHFTTLNMDSNTYTVALRSPFNSSDDYLLVDKERKAQSQIAMKDTDEIKLTANNYRADIQIENIENTYWAGTRLSELGADSEANAKTLGGAKVYLTQAKILVITFDSNADPWGAISKNLTSDTIGDASKTLCYPAYIISKETTPILMVSINWLRSYKGDLANRITADPREMESSDTKKYEIDTEGGPIQVDITNKVFAIGSTYTELGKDDKSPLIFKAANGDWYIDYRVIMGTTAGFILFDSGDSTKQFTPTGVTWNPINPAKTYPIKSLTGGDNVSLTVGALFKSDGGNPTKLLLEGPYSKSNYMLYKLNREGLRGDYLLVFKPKIEGLDDNSRDSVKKELTDRFKISLGDNAVCSIYNLDNTVSNLNPDGVIKKLSSCIERQPGYGYVYSVPSITGFSTTSYYTPTDDISNPLPIVSYKGSFYDINTNAVQGFPMSRVPYDLLTSEMQTLTANNDLIFDKGFKSAGDKLEFNSKSTMKPAPIGLTACYRDEKDKTVKELMESSYDSNYKALGSTGGSLETIATSATDYSFKIGGTYDYKIKDNDKFYLAGGNSSTAKNASKGIYVYKDPNGVGITSVNDLNSAYSASLLDGKPRNIFDWDAFSFIETLKLAEDISTISYIILLEIVPRIYLFLFLGLGVLSIVSNYAVVKMFCEKVFDPYKILSLGNLDVNTIDKKKIWFSAFWACVWLMLLNVQSFTNIMAYLLKNLLKILNR